MGANEYTPDTAAVRNCYGQRWYEQPEWQSDAEFNRWLNQVYAETQAKALEEVSSELKSESETFAKTAERLTGDDNTRYFAYAAARTSIASQLRLRAKQIREES